MNVTNFQKCIEVLTQVEVPMVGSVRINVPRILKERNIIPFDLVRQAGIAPGTAYKLADERQCANMSGITFGVVVRLCEFLDVDVCELLEYKKKE